MVEFLSSIGTWLDFILLSAIAISFYYLNKFCKEDNGQFKGQ